MGIIPGWRERGIGRRLIHATLEAADIAEFSRVELTVNAHNERTIRLYRSVGFVKEARKQKARFLDGEFPVWRWCFSRYGRRWANAGQRSAASVTGTE